MPRYNGAMSKRLQIAFVLTSWLGHGAQAIWSAVTGTRADERSTWPLLLGGVAALAGMVGAVITFPNQAVMQHAFGKLLGLLLLAVHHHGEEHQQKGGQGQRQGQQQQGGARCGHSRSLLAGGGAGGHGRCTDPSPWCMGSAHRPTRVWPTRATGQAVIQCAIALAAPASSRASRVRSNTCCAIAGLPPSEVIPSLPNSERQPSR